MINGSLVNTTSFEDDFSELTWGERGVVFVYILIMLVTSTVGNSFVLVMSKDLKVVISNIFYYCYSTAKDILAQ